MRIAVLESALSTSNHYIFVAVVDAFKRRPDISEVVALDLPSALARMTGAIDLLFIVGGEDLDSVIIKTLVSRAAITAVWLTEDPYEFSRNAKLVDTFDFVFTNDKRCASKYGPRAHHLPLAAPKSISHRVPFANRRYDLSFVATAWPNRVSLLSELHATLRTMKTKIILSSNAFLDEHLRNSALHYPLSSGVDFEDFKAIAQQSRLSLFVDRHFTTQINSDASSDTPGPRLFEVAAAGACVLADERVAGDLRSLGLLQSEDYFSFHSTAQCLELIEHYIREPTAFAAAAESLRGKVIDAHLYDHRIDVVLTAVRGGHRVETSPPDEGTRLTVLFVAHNVKQFASLGGSELYLEKLLEVYAGGGADRTSYLLARDTSDPFGAKFVVFDQRGEIVEEINSGQPIDMFSLDSPEFAARIQHLCARLQINYVFFNHTLGFPASCIASLRMLGIPYTIVLHDFFYVCDSFNLIDHAGKYCGIDRPNFKSCISCTQARLGVSGDSQYQRRNLYADILRHADHLITNQDFVFDQTRAALGLSRRDVSIIAPPILFEAETLPPREQRNTLHVAVVGNLYAHKGSMDLVEIVEQSTELDIVFEVFGKYDSQVRERLADANIIFHGPYELQSYPKAAIAKCDCALFLSKWPETYCMSLTETNALGLVPIAYAIGAFSARIDDTYGFLVESKPSAVVRILREVCKDRSRLPEKRHRIPPPSIEREFGDRYAEFFEMLSIVRRRTVVAGPAQDAFRLIYPCEAPRWNQRMNFWSTPDQSLPVTHTGAVQLVRMFMQHVYRFGFVSGLRSVARWVLKKI